MSLSVTLVDNMTSIRPIQLNESSSIIVSFFRVDRDTSKSQHLCSPDILVVAFQGKYRYGSAGNADADYMRAMAEAGLYATSPTSLILDFSELAYEWGDKIEWVLDSGIGKHGDSFFPMAVVVDDGCADGLQSLIRGTNSEDPIDDNQTFFWSVDDAITKIYKQIDDYRKSIAM